MHGVTPPLIIQQVDINRIRWKMFFMIALVGLSSWIRQTSGFDVRRDF